MDLAALQQRLQTHTAEDSNLPGEIRYAAVVAILRPGSSPGGFELFFIRRSESERDPWSGHMAFPGGRVDASDADEHAAAIREVLEEVGIDLRVHGRLLGRLSQVASPPMRSRVVVTPFVYVLQRDVPLKLDEREVASGHWFDLNRWLDGEGRGTFLFEFRGEELPLPRVDLDGHRVWGMTLRIVDDLLEQIAASS